MIDSKAIKEAIIPIVGINYKFQPILVTDVANAIVRAIEKKDNVGKIYYFPLKVISYLRIKVVRKNTKKFNN